GGVRTSIFHPGVATLPRRKQLGVPDSAAVVLNSRGFRQYVRNDSLFRAIPLVLRHRRDVVFVCTGMESSRVARQWLKALDIAPVVRLLPLLEPLQLADMFRLATATVSITE